MFTRRGPEYRLSLWEASFISIICQSTQHQWEGVQVSASGKEHRYS